MTRRTMTRPEAADLLHVGLDALPDEVHKAYRAQVSLAHPDRGGDVELFRRVVAARTAMLAAAPPTARRPAPIAAPRPENTESQATVVLVVAGVLVVASLAGWWLLAHETGASATPAPPATEGGLGWVDVTATVALVLACVPGLFVLRSSRRAGGRRSRGGQRMLPRGARRSLTAALRPLGRAR